MLKYKVFKSSEEFEKWQEENKVEICQIQPLVGGINMKEYENEFNGTCNVYIFVIYK
jgi:hypothetical protein